MATAPGPGWNVFGSRLAAHWLESGPEVLHRTLTGCLMSADLSGFTAMSERFASEGRRGAELLTDVVNGCFEALIGTATGEGGDVLKFGGDALLLWFEGDQAARRCAVAGARMQRALNAPKFAKAGLRMSVGAHAGRFDFFLVGESDWRELVLIGEPVTRTVALESAAGPGQVLVSPDLAGQLPEGWCGRRSGGKVPLVLDAVPRRSTGFAQPEAPSVEALVPPNLRADLRALTTLSGEHRLASIAFLELEGTDRSLAEVGAERMVGRLDDLIRATQQISRRYGVQFLYTDVIADGLKIISTAGAPTTTANDEESAMRYAAEFVHGDPFGKLRCGLNRGRVFAGFLGSPSRRTYTVMGDPVNLAARLMAHAVPGQVVATTDMMAASRAEFVSTELAPFMVKGKSEPIHAVVVERVGTGRRHGEATMLPLVGRTEELGRFRAWVSDAARGDGRAVEVVGEAGVGKSRLIAEVARDERFFVRMKLECQPYEENTAYAVTRTLVRRVVGIAPGSSRAESGRTLTRVVERVAPGLEPMLPLIAVVADAEVPGTPEADAIASEFRVERTHRAVVDLLAALLATPTLIQIEDGYYLDVASGALLSEMARRAGELPWMLVVTNRPGVDRALDAANVERVEVEPLPDRDAAELAVAALGVSHPGSEVATMVARSGGNPLFVLRLMEAVQAGVAAEDLPESVERVVAERLDRLNPSDRTLLRYAAVLGPRFDPDLLDQVLTLSGRPAVDAGAWRRLEDLVEDDGARHRRFRHVLYRDVAYEGLPFRGRARLHQRVGELLEASRHAGDVALLAEHFFRAGDHERTWRYSVAAGDRAWSGLAVTEAAIAYERALQVRRYVRGLSPHIVERVAETLGDVLERTADYDAAEAAYRTAGRVVPEHDERGRVRLLLKRGVLRERSGRYPAALRWYHRGLTQVEDGGEEALTAHLLVAVAGVMHRMGRIEECFANASLAAERARGAGDVATEAHACLILADWDGGGAEAREYGQRALKLFRDLGDVLYEGKAENNCGIVEYYGGNWAEAARHYERAADRFDAAGDVVEAASARNNLGEVLSDQGHVDTAIPIFERALAAWGRAHYPIGQALARSNLGRAQARAGLGHRAVTTLELALSEFEEIGAGQFIVDTRLRLVEAHLLLGETAAAAAVLDRVDADVAGGFPGAAATAARLRCWIARQWGRDEEALSHAREAVRLAVEGETPVERALALHEVAQLAGDRSAADEAAAELASFGVVRLPALPLPL